jgi:pimeloyl-ACP methyl ester carboxylesterase/TM2 domain-containing membrane protein YozV
MGRKGMKFKNKRRKPAMAAFLSLISTGLGQVYNGELYKGLFLKISLMISFSLFAWLVFKTPQELLLWALVLSFYVLLKLFSAAQAFIKSRELGSNYALKKFNNSPFYILLTIVFLVANVALPLQIAKFALTEMTPYHPFRSEKAKRRYLEFYDTKSKEWPVESETGVFDTSYGQTFVRISGPAEAPPLVLLPGASANSLMWLPNIQALSQDFHTYAVDNIYDFGRSVFTRKFRTPEDFVIWMDELFTAIGLGNNINLMGLSYGGWLTSQYVLHHPERLNKIVLLAPASTVLPLSPDFLKHSILSLVPHRHFTKKTMNWIMADWAEINRDDRLFMDDWMESIYLGARCFKPKMLVSPTVLTDNEWRNLKVLTLYMVGENEKIYSASKAIERLNKIAPQIKTELIPAAGHDLTVVQTDLVNRIIIKFLEQDNIIPA